MSVQARRTRNRGTVYDARVRGSDGREVKRTFPTKREAKLWEAEQRSAKARGGWIDPRASASTTLAQLAADWLASNPSKRSSSQARDESALRVHVLPVLGARAVGSLKPADVQRLVNGWNLAPSTVHRTYSALRAVLSLAVEREMILRTPCRGIRLPRVQTTPRRIPTPEDVAVVADALGPDYGAMAYIGAVLGLRWAEVAGLRVGRIDFLRSTLTVAEQLTRGEAGRSEVAPPKSAAGRRTLTVPAPLMEMLAEHLARRGLTGADADALVFAAPTGAPLRYSNWLRRVWQPATAAAGLGVLVRSSRGRQRYEGLGFHDLRRANATALVAEGVDMKTAQTRLGHANPRLTLALYAQATQEGDRAASERLGAHFLPASATITSTAEGVSYAAPERQFGAH